MHTTKLFSVQEDGNEIYKGSAVEICKHLNLPGKDIVYAYARNGYELYGRFKFIPAGVRQSEGNKKTLAKQERAKPKPTKHQRDLEWIRFHLVHDGNTGYHTNCREFRKELEMDGIYFKATKSKHFKGHYILERV